MNTFTSTYSKNFGLPFFGEKSNHLGNVLEVVTDRKLPFNSTNTQTNNSQTAYYTADVVSFSDYYPFGMLLPNRNGSESNGYEYGFNGMRKDDEIKNQVGTSYDFGARMYDPRVGRFFNRDPKEAQFQQSPYLFASNSPLLFIDMNGEYSVATHYIMTYRAAIKLGFSEDFATKIAHYSSVYADHPDWSYSAAVPYDMLSLNNAEMINCFLSPSRLEYDVEKFGSYEKTKDSQKSTFVTSVSIHAMKTYWEDISNEDAVNRALYGGVFEGKNGEKVVIEGAYNVVERLSDLNLSEKDWTESQLKELGMALHTIQDAHAHEGARWVTPETESAAEKLGHENEHPNGRCVVTKGGSDEAKSETEGVLMRMREVKSTIAAPSE